MSNAERFIDRFKYLEKVVRSVYGLDNSVSVTHYLSNKKKFRNIASDIRYLGEVRNILQHRERIDGNYPIEPTDECLNFLEDVIEKVENRPKAIDFAVKFKDIRYALSDSKVTSVMAIMKEKSYTYIPVMIASRIKGIFDENSLFNFLNDNPSVSIEDLTLNEMRDYLGLDNREMESFVFMSDSSYVDEVIDEFEKQFDLGKHLGVVFLTRTGSEKEKITAMMTAWDLFQNR